MGIVFSVARFFRIRIYKPVKCFLHKFYSILLPSEPAVDPDPVLPVTNPAPISSHTTFHHEDLEKISVSREEMCLAAFVEVIEDEEEDEEEEEVTSSVIVVVEERWIKHYSSRQRILLVGEGDFSFSACLAMAFGYASNVIATSLYSKEFLKKHYWNNAVSNIDEINSRGGIVMHGIDATKMANHRLLGQLKYDHIVYNFPYAGLGTLKDLPRQSQLEHHRSLVRRFLENAREMISDEGEIHITHKTNGFQAEWRVVSLARGGGLRLIEAVEFSHLDYPGYSTKCGFGGNKCFLCYPCKTYKFAL